jgi:hypothetical protein
MFILLDKLIKYFLTRNKLKNKNIKFKLIKVKNIKINNLLILDLHQLINLNRNWIKRIKENQLENLEKKDMKLTIIKIIKK